MATHERTRSLWGWGYADRFPAPEPRKAIGKMVEAMLGLRGLELREPAADGATTLPAPRLALPDGLCPLDASDDARMRHSYGKAWLDQVRGFAGDYAAAPDVVARPEREAEVEAVLAWADRVGAAVVPFGGGTSVVGGVEVARERAEAGVVCLDLGRMNQVLEVDPVSRLARIQAGALGPDLERQLAAHDLTLRFFPQSFEFSTLGGWVATRAGGHFATVWTHIDDLVAETRMLTPAGLFATRRLPASGAGPAPDRLVLGSEGALGVITEATVRVRPRPMFRASATARFASFAAAVEAARALAQSGLHPANARVLDATEARLNQVVRDGSHVLVIGFESADHPVDAAIQRALELARDHGGTCPEGPTLKAGGEKARSDGAEKWRSAFLDGPYLQSILLGLGVMADTFETACPWAAFEALDAAIRAAVLDVLVRRSGSGSIGCRFTHVYPDGPAPYYTFVAPIARGAEREVWSEVKASASDAILAHGGTITHHHAVGRTHRPWYDRERPALFGDVLRAAKRALDPRGIMNPGALVDP
ncbi:MAG: FAD-binding oxidoreductase [Myxococcota bacterium]